MAQHLHHVHIFASDIDRSLRFYEEMFNGEIVMDVEVAGARNVFMKIGTGRIHFYDQPPKYSGRGSIHHFGVQTDSLELDVEKMRSRGVPFSKGITDLGYMKYIMVPAPDDILVELFEVDISQIPANLHDYFES